MLLKSIKTKTALAFLTLCVSSSYPLTETAARNWAIAAGLGAATGTGVTAACLVSLTAIDSDHINTTSAGIGAVATVGVGVGAGYLTYKLLYQYTPKPVLKLAKRTLKQIEKDSAYAQNFLTLSQADILAQLEVMFGKDVAMKKSFKQFNGFIKDLDNVIYRLDCIKNDVVGTDLIKPYEKMQKRAEMLKSYINVRYALIVVSFASADSLLNREFKSYLEFGTNGQPSINEVIKHLSELRADLNTALRLLKALTVDKNINDELQSSIYSLNDLATAAKLLSNIVDLRIAQAEAFLTEQSFAVDSILSKYFTSDYDLTTYLNAHSSTSWPLIDAKKRLNNELECRKQAFQSAAKLLNSFDQDYSEYKNQCIALQAKLESFINIVETNLNFIAQSNEYFKQVRLYEEHLERERQRKLEQERFERQQALEREKIAEANRRERARLAQERQLAWEKQRQEEKKAEDRRKHEQDILDQKLAHERALQQQKLNAKNNPFQTPQPIDTPPPAYNPYQVINDPLPTPSAPPAPQNYSNDQPPSYESLFPTQPAYNPNYVVNDPLPTPSAPPAPEYDANDLPPSYESLSGYSTTERR